MKKGVKTVIVFCLTIAAVDLIACAIPYFLMYPIVFGRPPSVFAASHHIPLAWALFITCHVAFYGFHISANAKGISMLVQSLYLLFLGLMYGVVSLQGFPLFLEYRERVIAFQPCIVGINCCVAFASWFVISEIACWVALVQDWRTPEK